MSIPTSTPTNRIYNFSAGPAILPVSVLEEASQAVRELDGSGMSLLEMSHRGKHYDAIHNEAMENVLKTLGLSESEWSVIFMGGGASTQFTLVPMNFLTDDRVADYVDTGEWSSKAIAEGHRYGTVNVAGSSVESKYSRLPQSLILSPPNRGRYVHITTNNTIEGTQWQTIPGTFGVPLIADMSSDIFALDRDLSQFGLLYAGAQKNAGPAGVTVVVVRNSFLETAKSDLSPMLSYKTQASKDSLYNTPPVFSIYVMNLVMKWIAGEGGVREIERRNREKAALIYNALDAAPRLYHPTVTEKSDRSLMNITFRLRDEALEKELLAEAKANGMDGLPGHRNVGGLRASIYNAFPREGCMALAQLLVDFARRKG